MFKEKVKDLGLVYSNKTYNIVFENSDYTNNIVNATASCGCTKPKIKSDGSVHISYKPKTVPYHLRDTGYYDSNKYITVQYVDGTQDILIIKSRVKDY